MKLNWKKLCKKVITKYAPIKISHFFFSKEKQGNFLNSKSLVQTQFVNDIAKDIPLVYVHRTGQLVPLSAVSHASGECLKMIKYKMNIIQSV